MRLVAVAAVLASAAGFAACAATPDAAPIAAGRADITQTTNSGRSVSFGVAQFWPRTAHWPPPPALGSQYLPGTTHWPPPVGPLGPQYWPGTDNWPPPDALGSQTGDSLAPHPPDDSAPVGSEPDPRSAAAVLDQVGATETAYNQALRNPDKPELITVIEDATVEGSPARSEFIDTYSALIEAGRWARVHPETPSSVNALSPPNLFDDDVADILVCYISTDQVMERGPDGDPKVFSDDVAAYVLIQTFHLVHDEWRLYERSLVLRIEGETSCE